MRVEHLVRRLDALECRLAYERRRRVGRTSCEEQQNDWEKLGGGDAILGSGGQVMRRRPNRLEAPKIADLERNLDRGDDDGSVVYEMETVL